MKIPATGVLMTGGDSRRMGSPKYLLKKGNRALWEVQIERLNDNFTETVISARQGMIFPGFDGDILSDPSGVAGPMAGLIAALRKVESEWIFVLACDMPCISASFMQYLWMMTTTSGKIKIASWKGRLQPLAAFYHQSILPAMEEMAVQGKYSLTGCILSLEAPICEMNPESHPEFQHDFLNLNTPADWDEYVNSTGR